MNRRSFLAALCTVPAAAVGAFCVAKANLHGLPEWENGATSISGYRGQNRDAFTAWYCRRSYVEVHRPGRFGRLDGITGQPLLEG